MEVSTESCTRAIKNAKDQKNEFQTISSTIVLLGEIYQLPGFELQNVEVNSDQNAWMPIVLPDWAVSRPVRVSYFQFNSSCVKPRV